MSDTELSRKVREINKLKAENEKLRECVEFYAAEDNWEKYHDKSYSDCCIVNKDWSDNYSGNNGLKDIFAPKGGKLARQTLKELEGEKW